MKDCNDRNYAENKDEVHRKTVHPANASDSSTSVDSIKSSPSSATMKDTIQSKLSLAMSILHRLQAAASQQLQATVPQRPQVFILKEYKCSLSCIIHVGMLYHT